MTVADTMSKKTIMAMILQLILLLSYVNESQGIQCFLGPFLCGLLFPPSPPSAPTPVPPTTPQIPPPTPQNPPPSPSPPTKPSRPAGLKAGFYLGLCPNNIDIETIIKNRVQQEFSTNPLIGPAYLRMQFHDCFVKGCDASILIDGTSSEKKSDSNKSVRGYEFIDTLKALAEEKCPGFVSCADLIVIVTAEVLRLGGGPTYAVETGRCDGVVSNSGDVNLPVPSMTAQESIDAFAARGISRDDMVALLGCHTIGVAHCVFFQGRLYPGTSQFDPNMDPALRSELIKKCPQETQSSNINDAFLDQDPTSSNKVDNSYYKQIKLHRGLLQVDQAIANSTSTSPLVTQLAQDSNLFNIRLATAMVNLQRVGVLTGTQGQIRTNCRRFNN